MYLRPLICLISFLLKIVVAANEKPNILMIAVDDLNADLGCYGHPLVHSPNVDRLAKRGLRFDKAYCQYPVCNPSRSSFMTGLYPEQTGVLSNAGHFRNKNPDITSLSQHFINHGYFAARIGKIYHYGVPLQIGTDGVDDKASWNKVINPIGIDRTRQEEVITLKKGQYGGTMSWLLLNSKDEEHTDGKAALEAVKFMQEYHPEKTGKPFFLAVGFYRPHTPYVAPTHHAKHYPLDKINPVLEIPGDRDDIPPAALPDRPNQRELVLEQRKEIIQAYYASTTLMDACLGRILDGLDALKLNDNTIIVFLSDHGYHLGHHGLWQKSDLFEGSTKVPLIISVPKMKNAGQTSTSLTELVDLYPTLTELCNLPKPNHLKGQSLVPVLRNPKHSVRKAAFSTTRIRPPLPGITGKIKPLGRSIRTSRYRYTEWNEGKHGVELYDYRKDPREITNLALSASHKPLLKEMKLLFDHTRKRTN